MTTDHTDRTDGLAARGSHGVLLVLCLVFCVAGGASAERFRWPTLRAVLSTNVVPLEGVDDLDRTITSYAVMSDPAWFAIGYYWLDPVKSVALPTALRLRVYDRKKARWTSAVLDGGRLEVGSVMEIRRQARWLYVDTHINPSAGALLVLREDLTVRARLYGWSQAVLPDGRVVYANSMVHFAPAHPGSLSLYDPRTGRDVPLYPASREKAGSATWLVDRWFEAIKVDGGQVTFAVHEQRVTLQRDNTGKPQGLPRRLRVICDVTGSRPRCTSARAGR